MTPRFFADVHVRATIVDALRANGIEVVTAQEQGLAEGADVELLDHATASGCVLVTEDRDFLREAAERLRKGQSFATVLRIRQRTAGDSACIRSLLFFAAAAEPADLKDHVLFLPM